jgi:hypothetical protein
LLFGWGKTSKKKQGMSTTCSSCGQDISHIIEKKKVDAGNNRGLYPTVWAVKCEPSDSSHCKHKVGYFTSRDNASKAVHGKKSSLDIDDWVTWSYSFVEVTSKGISDDDMANLNPSTDLPY